MIKKGSVEIQNMHLGSTPVRAAYLGATKIWPRESSYTYTIENERAVYSSGTKINAGGTNSVQILATVKTWQGSVLVTTETDVVLTPVSGSSNFYVSGDTIKGRDRGTTSGNELSGTVYGSYYGTQSSPLTVYQEANTYTSSYNYRQSFTLDISGRIPSSGGTYNFTASSYRSEIRTWTSGSIQPLPEVAYSSTLSAVKSGVSFSTTSISGTVNGTATFQQNTSPSIAYYTIRLYNSMAGYSNYNYEQDALAYLTLSPSESPQHLAVGLSIVFSVNTNAASWSGSDSQKAGWIVTYDYARNIFTVTREQLSQATGTTITITDSNGLSATMVVRA